MTVTVRAIGLICDSETMLWIMKHVCDALNPEENGSGPLFPVIQKLEFQPSTLTLEEVTEAINAAVGTQITMNEVNSAIQTAINTAIGTALGGSY